MDIPLNSFKAEVIQILIVEDEFILAANLKESLESLGYNVVDIVDSAEIAIEKVAELHPDLVFMDIRLRGKMDGIDAAEKIWNSLQIPFIYVTGHSDKSTVEKATRQIEVLRLIAEGFSTKDIAELLNISSKTVEAHRVQLMKRLNIHDVVGLVHYAVWNKIVAFDTKKRINEKGEYRTKENP
jgi:DNA-binding NarL/FixJ family response regulator